MLKIDCDNPNLSKTLAQLCAEVEKCGGYFDDSLILKVENGDLSFSSNLPRDPRKVLISIPQKAFIPLTQLEFGLDRNNLVVASGEEKLNPNAASLLNLMLKVYNLTNKIQKYRTFSPRCAFQEDTELLRALASGRPETGIAKRVLEFIGASEQETQNLVVKSFLRTRNFSFKNSPKTLIPFIDFTNHNTAALPFRRERSESGEFAMQLVNSKPNEGENQCFARYGQWDCLDTYLMFGFSTKKPQYLRSIPIDIELGEVGKIKALGKVQGAFKGKLPEKIADLSHLFPAVNQVSPREMQISAILIPSLRWPFALKRILVVLVTTLSPNIEKIHLQEIVASAETQILNKNKAFYLSLSQLLEDRKEKYKSAPAYQEAVKMVKIQLGEIGAYENYFLNLARNSKDYGVA